MFKEILLSLVLIVGLGFQCNLKANNILNSDVQQVILENIGEQELEALEQVIEQSPEIQELLQGKAANEEILVCFYDSLYDYPLIFLLGLGCGFALCYRLIRCIDESYRLIEGGKND